MWTALHPRIVVWTPPFLQASPTPSQPPQAVTSLRSPASFFPCCLPPRRLRSPRVSSLSPSSPFCTQLSSSASTTGVMSSAHAEALGAKPLCSPAPLAASGEPPRALHPAVCRPRPQLSQCCPRPHPGAQSRALPSWPHLSVSFLKASLPPTGSKRDQPFLPSFPLNKAGSAKRPPFTSLSPGGAEGSKPVPATRGLLLWMQEISPNQGDARLLPGREKASFVAPPCLLLRCNFYREKSPFLGDSC